MSNSNTPQKPSLEALEDRWMPSTISGFVYHDMNGNGIQDANETGLSNVEVTLHNGQGTLISTTTTNAQGYYEFNNDPTIPVTPQTLVQEVTFSGTTDYVKNGEINQFDPSLGTLTSILVEYEGSFETQFKAENLDPVAAEVEQEFKGNFSLQVGTGGAAATLQTDEIKITQTRQLGAYDGNSDFAGTSGMDSGKKTETARKTLELKASQNDLSAFIGKGKLNLTNTADADACSCGSGNLLAMVQTSSQGRVKVTYTYTPATGLRPGDYIVREKTPTGYEDGYETQGNVTKIPNTMGTDELRITLTSTDNSTLNNFGEVKRSSLTGFVYQDCDDNGQMATGESGIATVSIRLTGMAYNGQMVDLTTTSGADGSYKFENLLPGHYEILEISQPTGYQNGRETAGSSGGTVSQDRIADINLHSDTRATGYNFGHYKPATLSGFVYHDANNDGTRQLTERGLAGSMIALTGTTGSGTPIYLTTTTAADGSYKFENLRPGVYTVVQLSQPAGYSDGKDSAGSRGGTVGNDIIELVTLTCENEAVEYNFGETLLPPPPPPPPPITYRPYSSKLFLIG